MSKLRVKLDNYFEVTKRGSTFSREILAGIVLFLAMVYILPVNAEIMSSTGIPRGAIFVATAIASGLTSLLMGLLAKYPIGLSCGMGMNSFIAFTVCGILGYSWQEALTLIFITSIIFFIISITNLRWKLINAISPDLKTLITCSLGGFLAFVGLKGAGIIVTSASTIVTLGDFSNPTVLLACFGIILAFILSNIKGKIQHFAILIALVVVAIFGFILHLLDVPNMPYFSNSVGDIDEIKETFWEAFKHFDVLKKPASYAVIFSILLVNFFDTSSTLLSVGGKAGLIKEDGKIENAQIVGTIDSLGTVISSTLGTTPMSGFVESNTAVEMGGRTGIVAIITGLLFLLSILIYPVFSIFSGVGGYTPVTALALVLVGASMFSSLKTINWEDKIITLTAFIMFIMMVLTYSISDGIGIALIFYTIMMIASKRAKEVGLPTYLISGLFVINYILRFTIF